MLETLARLVMEVLVEGVFRGFFRGLARVVGLFSHWGKGHGRVPLRQLWQQPEVLRQEASQLLNYSGQAFCIALLLIFWGFIAWVAFRHGWR